MSPESRLDVKESKTMRGIIDWEEEKKGQEMKVEATWVLAELSRGSLKLPMRVARIREED